MRHSTRFLAAALLCAASAAAFASDPDDRQQVIAYTRMLETTPFAADAPMARAWLLDWDDKSKDVVDYICPRVLDPIPDPSVPNAPQLLLQFIAGSATWQLEHPEDKGQLQPGQLAGMRSMLKAYRVMLGTDANNRIARFDELVTKDDAGTLQAYLEPIVAPCKG